MRNDSVPELGKQSQGYRLGYEVFHYYGRHKDGADTIHEGWYWRDANSVEVYGPYETEAEAESNVGKPLLSKLADFRI